MPVSFPRNRRRVPSAALSAALMPLAAFCLPSTARAQVLPPPPPLPQVAPVPLPAAPNGPSPTGGYAPRSRTPYAPTETADSPLAVWVPAYPGNFRYGDHRAIDVIVIHDIEGTAESAVRWFQNPEAGTTAHYVLDSDTGQIYQMVKERDIANQVGNPIYNGRAIGIEHGGIAYRPGFYNRVEYEASAKLVRDISARNKIPRDRTHIIGHFEVPDPTDPTRFGGRSHHTDPGPWWDWDYYMFLVRNDARVDTQSFPKSLHPGESARVTLTMTNLGDDPWPGRPAQTETPEAFYQRQKGLIYLGTWADDAAPLGLKSAFYVGAGDGFWTSDRLLAPVAAADVAPGSSATFTVAFRAPIGQLGPITEQFRLYQMPVAPHMPVPFGPVVKATIDVEPYEIVLAAAPSASFAAPTGWTAVAATGSTPAVYTFTPSPGAAPVAPVEWKTTLPVSGQWNVEVRWPDGPAHAAKAHYQVQLPPTADAPNAAGPAVDSLVDQRTGGGAAWHPLGRYTFSKARPAIVRLLAEAAPGETLTADAVRFVGPVAPTPPMTTDPAKAVTGTGPRP